MSTQGGIAFVFPGQGSQAVGMGRQLADTFPVAREVFARADDALGEPLSRLCFEGPESELNLTRNTQPAILTVSAAVNAVLAAHGLRPAAVAGHSLGEYGALVAAGALRFEDALRLVRRRGEWMQAAAPFGEGGMGAVIGLPEATVEQVLAGLQRGRQVLAIANVNCPGQVVVAGHRDALELAEAPLKAAGALMLVRLPVSAPFHCTLMQPAEDRLSALLEEVPLSAPACAFYNNVDGAKVVAPERIRDGLRRQVTRPVRWQRQIEAMLADGIDRFLEVGPGSVLAGTIGRISKAARSVSVSSPADLDLAFALAAPRREPEGAVASGASA